MLQLNVWFQFGVFGPIYNVSNFEIYISVKLNGELQGIQGLIPISMFYLGMNIYQSHSNGKRNCFHSLIGSLIEHNEKLQTDDNK